MDCNRDNPGIRNGASASAIRSLLISLASDILRVEVDPEQTLLAQGLDSMTAEELLEAIQGHGYDAEYDFLLDEASINSLVPRLRDKTENGPTPSPPDTLLKPMPLTGPQVIWSRLEQQGWGAWSNISVCISMPACVISAAYLPAIAQSLCDANDAMRMVLLPATSPEQTVMQRVLPDFQLPVQILQAPVSEKDAMRLVEAFEGEEAPPYRPSTRALILSSPDTDGRHWLCISMHHVFCDRIGMHGLTEQLREMILKKELSVTQQSSLGFSDVAVWLSALEDKACGQRPKTTLQALLAGADLSADRSMPVLACGEDAFPAGSPASSTLRPADGDALGLLATQLETTLPLLLHALFSVLVARLTGDEQALSGNADLLLCHVVSNRESHASLRKIVGCMDTSVPVAVRMNAGETLQSLCARTRHAFTESHRCVANLPRGEWLDQGEHNSVDSQQGSLFERVAHINILHSPAAEAEEADGIRVHPVRRVQKTRWGLLLRVALCPANVAGASEIRISAFAEHRPLATMAHVCFVAMLRALLAEHRHGPGELPVLDFVDQIIRRTGFAADQVRRAAAQLSSDSSGESFIYDKLIARQQRWYEHDQRYRLCRDELNRFIGTSANPFPFTQLDKLKERQFLDTLEIPQPRLLHILPKENLQISLTELAPTLPDSFAIKPVGAGHSFGVTLVRNGLDLTQHNMPFDAQKTAAELSEMADRGYCVHQGNVFRFNFSSFLVEELVVDEKGFDAPTDYKVFMSGSEVLWIQLHFREEGYTWVGFVDEGFTILPEPAWDPGTCWRTHGALVCTEQSMLTARKPGCLTEILELSKQLGARLNIFVRLDWYADKNHGPLMGEMTTFPHMLQPRSFYSRWANARVREVWQDPDGGAPKAVDSVDPVENELVERVQEKLNHKSSRRVSLLDFLPQQSQAPWAGDGNPDYGTLRRYIASFDLASRGIEGGDCVALFVHNGLQLGALLLATMNRYVALPVDVEHQGLLVSQLQECNARALIVISGTREARLAAIAAEHMRGLVVIELAQDGQSALPSLPGMAGEFSDTLMRAPDDEVLLLRTSGTTGEPKIISFTLSRLLQGGAVIGQSLGLSQADLGISMLPLHHVGGISCNLVAPLLSGTPMHFYRAFDPRAFFDALAGRNGATWCYLVPALWGMILEYARAHPELRKNRPWPRLRLLRNAGADLPGSVARELAELFGDAVCILPTYGMTEAMPVSAPPVTYQLERPGSVGPALPTVSIEIIDFTETGNLSVVADGTIGEVTVTGPSVLPAQDYDEQSVPGRYTPRGYFRTGDLGRLEADGSGWLYITGRIKEAINRGGETLAPVEIENVLRNYPGWHDTDVQLMIFARAHTTLHEDVALAIAPYSDGLKLAQLNAWAANHLPSSMLPKTLVHLSALPHSKAGKLSRALFAKQVNKVLAPAELGTLRAYSWDSHLSLPRLLEEASESAAGLDDSDTTPDVSIDSVLAIVRDFCSDGVKVGPDTVLNDAGVNSLAAVELSGRLNLRFSTRLPPWVISDYPTPRALYDQLILDTKASGTQAADSVPDPVLADDTADQKPVSKEPLRILLLHGEGGDAELMDLSMQATHWTGHLEDLVEFIFIDAPHCCDPKPQFHPAAVEVGLYSKEAYRSWGTTDPKTLDESIVTVLSALDEIGSVDGIGGICDGGLVAAVIAARRPELKLYLNIASSPLTRLAEGFLKTPLQITCSSVHLISAKDEMLTFQELMDIPALCRKALLLQHDRGHAVPSMDNSLRQEMLAVLNPVSPGSAQHERDNLSSVTVDQLYSAADNMGINSD